MDENYVESSCLQTPMHKENRLHLFEIIINFHNVQTIKINLMLKVPR